MRVFFYHNQDIEDNAMASGINNVGIELAHLPAEREFIYVEGVKYTVLNRVFHINKSGYHEVHLVLI